MKRLIIAYFVLSVGIASAYAGGMMMLQVGSSDGNGGGPVVSCDQTGLDFTLNCNIILIPALIH